MIVLGITGGVGCGKTEVLNYIKEKYNVKLIIMDNLAKLLISKDSETAEKLKQEFINEEIFDVNGNYDKDKVSKLIFNDKEKLKRINNIIHPRVKKIVMDEIENKSNKNTYDALIIESALLLEGEYDKIMDCIYVYADIDVRKSRLFNNRGYSDEKTESIINNQMMESVYQKRCKYIIDNSNDFNETKKAIDKLLCETYRLRRVYG